jgi:hypothetical protein
LDELLEKSISRSDAEIAVGKRLKIKKISHAKKMYKPLMDANKRKLKNYSSESGQFLLAWDYFYFWFILFAISALTSLTGRTGESRMTENLHKKRVRRPHAPPLLSVH